MLDPLSHLFAIGKQPTALFTVFHTGVNEQGLTPSTSRKGLSLKARKRKFVMSPSKPRQRNPVKQVFRKHRDEDGTMTSQQDHVA